MGEHPTLPTVQLTAHLSEDGRVLPSLLGPLPTIDPTLDTLSSPALPKSKQVLLVDGSPAPHWPRSHFQRLMSHLSMVMIHFLPATIWSGWLDDF